MDKTDIHEFDRIVSQFRTAILGFGRIIAVSVEVEMMKAANEERRMKGQSDAYGEDAFAVAMNTISEILPSI